MAAILPVDAKAAGNAPAVAQQDDPSVPSSDYSHDVLFWKMTSDILGGADAMRATQSNVGRVGGPAVQYENVPTQRFSSMRGFEQESPYLPKFPNEPFEEYDRRRRNAFLTNIYGDISNNLSSKPFSKTCDLADGTSADLVNIAKNIDGLGNNMHVFARDIFKTAMDKAITWILCDFTTVPSGSTLDDERKMGARAYWVHIPAEKLLAVYSKFLNGKEIIFHARIDEAVVELDGYEETVVNRVRELNREPMLDGAGNIIGFAPATWVVYEEDVQKDAQGKDISTWAAIDGGDISIGVIPLVPVILGKRDGTSWRIAPPLRDLTYMQVKLFQMESNLDSIKELTAFPMLAGDGINGMDDKGAVIKVPVGPRGVLFAPALASGRPGQWHFIEPAGSSLTFLQSEIEKHKNEMRDLGFQPLTAANLTVITTANISVKAHSAVQAWALMLKDALEQAWKITSLWLQQINTEVVVDVYTDFGVDIDAPADLVFLQGIQASGVISKKLLFNEGKRRGVLADEADFDKDQEQQATEQANDVLQPEVHVDPVTGAPVAVTPKPGTLNPPPKPPIKVRPGERIVN